MALGAPLGSGMAMELFSDMVKERRDLKDTMVS
jgi:hypothetical protein